MKPINEYLLSNKSKSIVNTNSLEQLKEKLDNVVINKEYNDELYNFLSKLTKIHSELDNLFDYMNNLIDTYMKMHVFITYNKNLYDGSHTKETYEISFAFGGYAHIIVFQFWKDLDIIGTKFSNASSRKMFTVKCDAKSTFELPKSNNGYKYDEYSEPITSENIDTIIDCVGKWIKRGFKI